MTGTFATPWPEKEVVSGGIYINPDGEIILVPYIDQYSTLTGNSSINDFFSSTEPNVLVDDTVCTSNTVTLDGEPYSLLNCELILDTNILFITLYISEEGDVIGGVYLKKQFDEYLLMESSGFLLDRWSFASL